VISLVLGVVGLMAVFAPLILINFGMERDVASSLTIIGLLLYAVGAILYLTKALSFLEQNVWSYLKRLIGRQSASSSNLDISKFYEKYQIEVEHKANGTALCTVREREAFTLHPSWCLVACFFSQKRAEKFVHKLVREDYKKYLAKERRKTVKTEYYQLDSSGHRKYDVEQGFAVR
jgi:hypothetical protein